MSDETALSNEQILVLYKTLERRMNQKRKSAEMVDTPVILLRELFKTSKQMRYKLSRIVATEDDLIRELKLDTDNKIELVSGETLYFKIHVKDLHGPLHAFADYFDIHTNQSLNSKRDLHLVQVIGSQVQTLPKSGQMFNTPRQFELRAHNTIGKAPFVLPWYYIALVCHPPMAGDCYVRLKIKNEKSLKQNN